MGCWEHIPGDMVLPAGCWELASRRWILGAGFWEQDATGGGVVLPIHWAWQPSRGSHARLPLSRNNTALAQECCAFSRRDFGAGSMQSLARGHTEPDLHGPGVTQRQSCADGDRCAGSVTKTRLPHLSPKMSMVGMVRMVRMGRMVPWNNPSPSRAGDA